MKFTKPVLWVAVLTAAIMGSVGSSFALYSRATETPRENLEGSVSQVLIEEIRALRKALQESSTGNVGVQIAIERCRLQQLKIGGLSDEYNLIQSQIDGIDDLIPQMEATAKNLEHNLSNEIEPTRRIEIEREQKAVAANIEQNKQRAQRLAERSVQVRAMLASERDKLDDLTRSLDLLSQTKKE